ncbi:hypothetical protein EJB05_35670, partial [Eragrostis curvula]
METGAIVVSAVVGLFGVASAILGFVAEAKKLTPHDIDLSRSKCVYPANPAFALASCALLLLVVAQIIASAAGGCCGCCRPQAGASRTNRVLGIVASVLSWIAALFAGASYLQGAAWNAATTRYPVQGRCYILKGGVLTRGAVLSLVATALGIVSYIMLTRATPPPTTAAAGTQPKANDGLNPPAVGLPQWPAQGHGQAPNPHHGGVVV